MFRLFCFLLHWIENYTRNRPLQKMEYEMIKKLVLVGCALLFPVFASGSSALNEEQVKQSIIKESIAKYPGNCPCPYNSDRAGRSCGRRSAYSKPGGYAPLCYSNDVSKEMVQEWKKRHP